MPAQLNLEGPADEMVLLQVRLPRWLKRKAAEAAGKLGKDLTDWVRDLIREETDTEPEKRRRTRR